MGRIYTVNEYRAQILDAISLEYTEDSWQYNSLKKTAELLRDLAPRVLTEEEARKRVDDYKFLLTLASPVYIQFKPGVLSAHDEAVVPRWRDGVNQEKMLRDGEYGVWYVFWTGRPTDDQMREVKWDV